MSGSLDLEKIVYTAEVVVQALEAAMETLQKLQRTLPVPTLEEVAGMRQGKRALTLEAYLHGLLHRSLVAGEDLASDLRAVDLEMLCSVHELRLSGVELKAIEQAVFERRRDS